MQKQRRRPDCPGDSGKPTSLLVSLTLLFRFSLSCLLLWRSCLEEARLLLAIAHWLHLLGAQVRGVLTRPLPQGSRPSVPAREGVWEACAFSKHLLGLWVARDGAENSWGAAETRSMNPAPWAPGTQSREVPPKAVHR